MIPSDEIEQKFLRELRNYKITLLGILACILVMGGLCLWQLGKEQAACIEALVACS